MRLSDVQFFCINSWILTVLYSYFMARVPITNNTRVFHLFDGCFYDCVIRTDGDDNDNDGKRSRIA